MIETEKFERVIAWLIRNEAVNVAKIERAVRSADSIHPGDSITLAWGETDNEIQTDSLRRAFCQEQARILSNK